MDRIVKFVMCMLLIMLFAKEQEMESIADYIYLVLLSLVTVWTVWAFVI